MTLDLRKRISERSRVISYFGRTREGCLDCRKTPSEVFDKVLRPDPRIICPSMPVKFHTLRPSCIFPEVHAPVENDFNFICRRGGKLLAAVSGDAALCPFGTARLFGHDVHPRRVLFYAINFPIRERTSIWTG